MEFVTWIIVGILAGFASIVLIPVLVVGTWYVVMTAILGLVNGMVWLLDRRWKHEKRIAVVERLYPDLPKASSKVALTG